MMTAIFAVNAKKAISISRSFSERQPIKVAQFSKELTDDYIEDIDQGLKDFQKENEGKVEFTFYDSKSDTAIQNENIDKVLKEGVDLILRYSGYKRYTRSY